VPRGSFCPCNVVGSFPYVVVNRQVLLTRLFILAKRPFPTGLAHRNPIKKSVAGIMTFIHDAIAPRAIINFVHGLKRLIGWKSIQDVSDFRQCELHALSSASKWNRKSLDATLTTNGCKVRGGAANCLPLMFEVERSGHTSSNLKVLHVPQDGFKPSTAYKVDIHNGRLLEQPPPGAARKGSAVSDLGIATRGLGFAALWVQLVYITSGNLLPTASFWSPALLATVSSRTICLQIGKRDGHSDATLQ
jgi:hypothetical protein